MTTPSPSLITRKRLCLDRLLFKIVDVWHGKTFSVVCSSSYCSISDNLPFQCFFDTVCIKLVLYLMCSPWSKINVFIRWNKTRFRQRETSKHSEKPEEAEYTAPTAICFMRGEPCNTYAKQSGFCTKNKKLGFFSLSLFSWKAFQNHDMKLYSLLTSKCCPWATAAELTSG